MRSHQVPIGWECVPLSNVAAIQTGIAKGKAVNGKAVSIPYLRVANVQDGYTDLSVIKEITVSPNDIKRYSLRCGDVLFTEGGDFDKLGRGTVWKGEIANCLHQNHVFAVRVDQDHLIPEFLAYQASSNYGRYYFQLSSKQSTNLASINSTQLKAFPVLRPPIEEQQKLTEIIRTWDEAVRGIERLIQIREHQHLALTHQLVFGRRRLTNFDRRGGFTEYRWFNLPSDWQSVPIGKLAKEISEKNSDGTFREVLSCSKYEGFVPSLEYFNKQIFSGNLSSYKKICRGDFGFPSNHVEEGSIGLQDLVDVGLVSPIYTIFRFDARKVDNAYAFGVLKTSLYRHIFEVSTSASVDRRGSLRWKEFAQIPFPVPSLSEQRAISSVLSQNRGLIEKLKSERDALNRQKRGLMQKLLTGEWRVSPESCKEAAE